MMYMVGAEKARFEWDPGGDCAATEYDRLNAMAVIDDLWIS